MSDGTFLRQCLAKAVELQDRSLVEKISGKIFVSNSAVEALEDVAIILRLGIRLVVVCGCGPQVDNVLRERELPITKIDGIRVTTSATIEIMQEVYDLMKKQIGAIFNRLGQNLHVLWPEDAVVAAPLGNDFGLTGKVDSVDIRNLTDYLIEHPYAPTVHFVSSLAKGVDGRIYNVNADSIAAAIAVNLPRCELAFLGDGAVYENREILTRITASKAKELVTNQVATAGMGVKLTAAYDACRAGVRKVHIVGNRSGELLLSIFTDGGSGTVVEPDKA